MQNPISWDVSFPKKSTICIFVIFYNHLHQGWFLANLPPYPHPMGHPTRPTTHLPSFMFFVSNKSKKDAWSWKFNCFCDFSKWWVGLQFWPFLAFSGQLWVSGAVRGWHKNAQRWFLLVIHMVHRAQTSVEHAQSILCNSWTRQCATCNRRVCVTDVCYVCYGTTGRPMELRTIRQALL